MSDEAPGKPSPPHWHRPGRSGRRILRHSLVTLPGVIAELGCTYRAYKSGKIDAETARTRAYLLDRLRRGLKPRSWASCSSGWMNWKREPKAEGGQRRPTLAAGGEIEECEDVAHPSKTGRSQMRGLSQLASVNGDEFDELWNQLAKRGRL